MESPSQSFACSLAFPINNMPDDSLRLGIGSCGEVNRLRTASKHYFLGRNVIPADPSEVRRTERWLASARLFLAASALAAVYMDPTQLGHAPVAYGLMGLY